MDRGMGIWLLELVGDWKFVRDARRVDPSKHSTLLLNRKPYRNNLTTVPQPSHLNPPTSALYCPPHTKKPRVTHAQPPKRGPIPSPLVQWLGVRIYCTACRKTQHSRIPDLRHWVQTLWSADGSSGRRSHCLRCTTGCPSMRMRWYGDERSGVLPRLYMAKGKCGVCGCL